MTRPERSPERDAALVAMLPEVPCRGWTVAGLRHAAGADADLLFPGGAPDMVEAYCDLADRWMEEDAANAGLLSLRTPERVRAIILLRLARAEPHREAVRRAVGVLALPGRQTLALVCTARTVDTIWHAAGDRAADVSWYSKRAILAGVYGTTVLRWLADSSEDAADTAAFLDRRLAGIALLGRLRRRLGPRHA